jgi:hypothetical protein
MKTLRVIGVLVVASGFMIGQFLQAACDDKLASESVGACHTDCLTCASFVTSATCLDAENGALYVKQDFPTACVSGPGKNCHELNDQCYRPTLCNWDGASCSSVAQFGNTSPWTMKTRRITQFCGGAGGGDPE